MGIAEMLDELKQKASHDPKLRGKKQHNHFLHFAVNAGNLDTRSTTWI